MPSRQVEKHQLKNLAARARAEKWSIDAAELVLGSRLGEWRGLAVACKARETPLRPYPKLRTLHHLRLSSIDILYEESLARRAGLLLCRGSAFAPCFAAFVWVRGARVGSGAAWASKARPARFSSLQGLARIQSSKP
jgi:hypothetical protein